MDGSAFGSLLFPILIIAIFYLLVFRPQQKKMKEHANMVANIRRGDVVVTQGGVIGKVTKVKEKEANELEVQVSDGVTIRVVQTTISDVRSKTEPAK
ncbi:MAG: preprotein translocase subunit YajC [Pseudomonadota bacterium]